MALRLYNTASRKVEEFTPAPPQSVTMYNCGPTVYNFIHVGNLRPYVFADVLRRTLEWSGYEVHQIVNITDVGHLVDDADDTEDKMTVALKREGKPLTTQSMREVGEFYTEKFREDISRLNILPAENYPKASDHIKEDIEMTELLTQKGFTYSTSDGIYFDTTKFPRYPEFAKLDVSGMQAGARVEIGEKRFATDFAIWKFNDSLGYDAPFGKGFPGWHIECSAMAKKYLGLTLDIHTGGVDHIPVHHTNEIAQSECANGAPLARFWLHNAHVLMDNEKMSKSLGNVYRLGDLYERGIPPLAYRYWLLTAHYRTQVNFTWEALAGAQTAYNRLTNFMVENREDDGVLLPRYVDGFRTALEDDLNTASAISLIWTLLKDTEVSAREKRALLLEFDKVLGLGLDRVAERVVVHVSDDIQTLVEARKLAREAKDWDEADRLRDMLREQGFDIKDTAVGQEVTALGA